MTTAVNIATTFTNEDELNKAIAIEDAARKFLEIKKLAEEYAVLAEIAREELLAVVGDVSEYITGAEFGELRVTITPTHTPQYDKKQLLELALNADPKREKLFKLDESKAKKLSGAEKAIVGTKTGYRVEVRSNI